MKYLATLATAKWIYPVTQNFIYSINLMGFPSSSQNLMGSSSVHATHCHPVIWKLDWQFLCNPASSLLDLFFSHLTRSFFCRLQCKVCIVKVTVVKSVDDRAHMLYMTSHATMPATSPDILLHTTQTPHNPQHATHFRSGQQLHYH